MNNAPRSPSSGGPGTGNYDLSGLEPSYRSGLEDVAAREGVPVDKLLADIDAARGTTGLVDAVRAVVLTYFRILYEDRSGLAGSSAPQGRVIERAMAVLKEDGKEDG
ncbi:ribbon-helix-helix domain-containing protein [Arenibaculum sp.]|uniref:ribbon-helix-helix domain-containing protein n=1 Tax=Arenibaculum sp. TaxID=2865862 RepID=UPI002E154D2E|nr:ribbon-helix-helix domain-containing protein [Arenibaculum sp.]